MNRFPLKKNQAGLTLVEMAIASVIFGLAALVAWQLAVGQKTSAENVQDQQLLTRATAALTGFAFFHNRSVCPAPDTSGAESCGGALKGYLPYKTLGLPVAAGKLRYSLPATAADLLAPPSFNILRPVASGPAYDLTTTSVALDSLATKPNDHSLDFCAVLMDPALGANEAYTVAIDQPGAPVTLRPSLTASRASLGGQLRCGGLLSAAGRVPFDTTLAAATLSRSLKDYQTQFDVTFGLFNWDLAQGVLFLVKSAYKTAKTLIKIHLGTSLFFGSYMTKASSMVKAIAAMPSTLGYSITLTNNIARFSFNLIQGKADRVLTDQMVADGQRLAIEVTRNAALNATSRFFLAEQKLPALQPVPPVPPVPGPYAGGGNFTRDAAQQMNALKGVIGVGNTSAITAAVNQLLQAIPANQPGLPRDCDFPGTPACDTYLKRLVDNARGSL